MQTPPFSLEDNIWWTATVKLPSWSGFQARGGAYGSVSSAHPSDGTVRVRFAPEGRGTEPLLASEQRLIDWVFGHEPQVSEAAQHALLDAYADLPAKFGYGADDCAAIPVASKIDDLKKLVGLVSVNIHQVNRDGVPYIGFELGCSWEEEHGLGVLMHGTRVVEVGLADTAILLWLAEQHSEGRRNSNSA